MSALKLTWNKIADVPKTYDALCRVHLPRPIHDKIDLQNATEIVDFLSGHKLNGDQEDYLDLLSDLVAEYEDEHLPFKTRKISGAALLAYLLEENGLNASDLSRILGTDRTLGAKILRGERNLTAEHMKKLGRRFAVDPGLFLR
jgi:HTH-type transcriptional regulator / antitoxin HigA